MSKLQTALTAGSIFQVRVPKTPYGSHDILRYVYVLRATIIIKS